MRCFIAIELPAHIREKLADLQTRLQDLDRCVRWTKPEQIHLTIKFLGEVPDSQVTDVCSRTIEIAKTLAPIELTVESVGCFPPRGPARVVWAGIGGPPQELIACHAAIEQACSNLGFPPEDRHFSPHLTVGRSRDPRGAREARSVIEHITDYHLGRFRADAVMVFQSILGRAGPTYNVLAHAPLGRS